VRDAIGMILLVERDGRLGPLEPRRGGKGVDGVHLLLGDAVLPAGLVRLGAPKDHEATSASEDSASSSGVTSAGSPALGQASGPCLVGRGFCGCSP
jgi:hypothetical protein